MPRPSSKGTQVFPRRKNHRKDVVSLIEEKLKLQLPSPIVEATRAELRVLKIRHPLGSFGKYDNDMKRACALLDYVVREYPNNNSDGSRLEPIRLDRLSKVAFMKEKDFCEFHHKIGNFRSVGAVSVHGKNRHTKPTNTATRKIPARRKQNETGMVVNPHTVRFQNSSIPAMAIQLGAFVANSCEVAQQAQEYFHGMVGLLQQASHSIRLHGLHDMQRHQFCYEAACFYVVATTDRHDTLEAPPRRRTATTKFHHNGGDDEEHEDGTTRQLGLSLFLDVIKPPSQFHTVLNYVKELQKDVLAFKQRKTETNRYNGASTIVKRLPKSTMVSSNATRKRLKNERAPPIDGHHIAVSTTMIETTTNTTLEEENNIASKQTRFNNTKETNVGRRQDLFFDEWKSKTLFAACEKTREKIKKRRDKIDSDRDGIDSERILDCAAREILTGYGMA